MFTIGSVVFCDMCYFSYSFGGLLRFSISPFFLRLYFYALFCFSQHDFVSGYMLQLLGASVMDISIFSPPSFFYA
jgi:hypothetical protein